MKCVFKNSVWVGNATDARSPTKLLEQEFHAVIDLALDEPPAILPRELVYLRFPLNDGEGNEFKVLAAAIKTISLLIGLPNFKILVCCSAGLSRSPAITAASIAISDNKNPDQVLTNIAELTHCDVSPTLWAEISKVCEFLQS